MHTSLKLLYSNRNIDGTTTDHSLLKCLEPEYFEILDFSSGCGYFHICSELSWGWDPSLKLKIHLYFTYSLHIWPVSNFI